MEDLPDVAGDFFIHVETGTNENCLRAELQGPFGRHGGADAEFAGFIAGGGNNAATAFRGTTYHDGLAAEVWVVTLLYGRVDLVRSGTKFRVMELELIEPALYLRMDPGAPDRFADAVVSLLA